MRKHVLSLIFLFLTGVLYAAAESSAQIVFVDVSASKGIQPYTMAGGMGAGIAAVDYDDDGDIDVFVPTANGVPNQLYRNQGNGQFDEVASLVGLDSLGGIRAALWFDYDGDGDYDLVTACDDNTFCAGGPTLQLYRQNSDGTFTDVSVQAGLTSVLVPDESSHFGGMCVGDINNDHYLDLYVGVWEGFAYLYLNNGQGGFTDISVQSGVYEYRLYWQSMMYDFNGDGWIDIINGCDFGPNVLWINQKDNTFVDVAAQVGVDTAFNEMGMTLGDYDNDTDIDIYITNVTRDGKHNVLFRNDTVGSNLSFVEVSEAVGVDVGYWGWGTTFLDADLDGRLDIAATNGAWTGEWAVDPSKFYMNQGGNPVTFSDESVGVQFDDTEWGSGLIAFDMDRDGDLDLMQACADGGSLRLLENQPSGARGSNHYLVVRPRMNGPNRYSIGAVVRATAGATTWTRPISAGTSFLSQEPAEAFFGLGTVASVDTLTIDWPDGSQTVLSNVVADQVFTFTHGGPGDLNADGLINLTDFASFGACYGLSAPTGACDEVQLRLSDLDHDGQVDLTDFATFALRFAG